MVRTTSEFVSGPSCLVGPASSRPRAPPFRLPTGCRSSNRDGPRVPFPWRAEAACHVCQRTRAGQNSAPWARSKKNDPAQTWGLPKSVIEVPPPPALSFKTQAPSPPRDMAARAHDSPRSAVHKALDRVLGAGQPAPESPQQTAAFRFDASGQAQGLGRFTHSAIQDRRLKRRRGPRQVHRRTAPDLGPRVETSAQAPVKLIHPSPAIPLKLGCFREQCHPPSHNPRGPLYNKGDGRSPANLTSRKGSPSSLAGGRRAASSAVPFPRGPHFGQSYAVRS